MSKVVLDSSALLALLLREPGAEIVVDSLEDGACIGAVNLSEVVSKLQEMGKNEGIIRFDIATTKFDVMDFGADLAWQAGLLRERTRSLGLSLGDRACLALAASLDLPVLTADRSWANLDIGVEVVLCR